MGSSGSGGASGPIKIPFLCSTASRSFVPTAMALTRRAQLMSRIAQQPHRGAKGVLDGSEHGATIIRSGD
jgi:hypothetical protein